MSADLTDRAQHLTFQLRRESELGELLAKQRDVVRVAPLAEVAPERLAVFVVPFIGRPDRIDEDQVRQSLRDEDVPVAD